MRIFKKGSSKPAPRRPSLMPGQDDYVFRRSRTLTGTTSNKVAASAERNSQLKTSRLQVHELHGHKHHLVRLLVACGAASLATMLLMFNFIGTPDFVTASRGATAVPTASYTHSLRQYFKVHPLQRFGLFLDKSSLTQYMMSRHGELKAFTPDTGLFNTTAEFSVAFRQPVLAWQATTGQRFLVDDEGVAFTYDFYQKEYVAVTDESGLSPQDGGAVASGRFVRFLGQLVGAINRQQAGKVTGITIPTAARQVDIRLEGREYPLKTHMDRPPEQQASDIASALRWFDERHIQPQYIDVRVGGKAFYK